MNSRTRRKTGRILAEMGIIVFSVLLALAVNEWRQAQTRSATLATVRQTILAEAEQNRAQVERALAHHRGLVTQLREGGVVLARLDLRRDGIDTTSAAALARSLGSAARLAGAPADVAFTAERDTPAQWRVRHDNRELVLQLHGDSAVLRGPGNISLQPAFLIDSAWETAQVTQAAVHMDPQVIASMARVRQLSRMVDSTVSRLVDILYSADGQGDIIAALSDLVMMEQNLLAAYEDLTTRLH